MANLALTMRPTTLDEVLGADNVKRAVKSFAASGNWPNVFLFYGIPGVGKTTLAKIIAKMAGAEGDGLHEINASADNGVDFARQLAEMSASHPFSGQRRVFILNEFEQFSQAAQRSLKDPMEQNPAIWILTTNNVSKIDAAIISRASAATFELKPLSQKEIIDLAERALLAANPEGDWVSDEAAYWLYDHDVRQPREILGVLDQWFAGVPLERAVHGSQHEPLYADIAKAVLSGNWTKASEDLSKIKTPDSRAMIGTVSAFLRNALLRSSDGPRADALAVCLTGLDQTGFQDGVAYGSVCGLLYRCCKALSKVSHQT